MLSQMEFKRCRTGENGEVIPDENGNEWYVVGDDGNIYCMGWDKAFTDGYPFDFGGSRLYLPALKGVVNLVITSNPEFIGIAEDVTDLYLGEGPTLRIPRDQFPSLRRVWLDAPGRVDYSDLRDLMAIFLLPTEDKIPTYKYGFVASSAVDGYIFDDDPVTGYSTMIWGWKTSTPSCGCCNKKDQCLFFVSEV